MTRTPFSLFLLLFFLMIAFTQIEAKAKHHSVPFSVADYITLYHQPVLDVYDGNVFLDLSSVKLTEKYIENLHLSKDEKIHVIKTLHLTSLSDKQLDTISFTAHDIATLLFNHPRITKSEQEELAAKDEKLRSIRRVVLTSLEGLDRIHPHHISGIDFSGNELRSVEPELLSRFTDLRVLYLSNNKLKALPPGGLGGLDRLEKLYLNGNRFRSLHPSSFSTLPNLKVLNLSNNRLNSLPIGESWGLDKLERLNLSGNHLRVIYENTFTHLDHLTHLDLSNNKLAALPNYGFVFLKKLNSLYIHSNRLKNLEPHLFHGPSELRELQLHENPIDVSDLHFLVDTQKSLQSLTMDIEMLSSLPITLFPELTKLYIYGNTDISAHDTMRSQYKIPADVEMQFIYDNGFLSEH